VHHVIPVEELGAQGSAMAGAVGACVHCGFCLPTCPTYVTMGEEMDSPRGRIFLMKEVLEGEMELEVALPFIDNCLGCQACQTACPSGVDYGALITPFRGWAEPRRRRTPMGRAERMLILQTLPHPRRFRAAARTGRLAKPLAGRVPGALDAMLRLLPDELPAPQPLPELHPAQGERRARVALLAGCAQQVLDPDIGWATLRVLARNGVETVVPRGQRCCGSLAAHTGAHDAARATARHNLDAFALDDVDAVVTTAAGCGSGMREYGLLFAGRPQEAAARKLADRVVDVSVFLAALGLREAPSLDHELAVAYQDACHLAHAQGVRREPRDLLRAIGGVRLVEPAEWELCCGSAGTYNVERPGVAAELGARKAANLTATGADVVVSANIGCMTQLRTHLGDRLPVLHTMQLLDRAYDSGPWTTASSARRDCGSRR
jgi:glycolate oxidase iron-sulfur subunit